MIIYQNPILRAETLIFLNGQRSDISDVMVKLDDYQHLIIADGAWNDLHGTPIGERILQNQAIGNDKTDKPNINTVIGDGDSIISAPIGFIETPDQNYTDFEKIILYLLNKGINSADIYWGSGGEMDHFLGNLSVAAKYGHAIQLRFFDDTHCYFYTAENVQIIGAENKQLTLYPFPKSLVSSGGLRYELDNTLLKQYDKQSLRNEIIAPIADIQLRGNAFVFVEL